MTSRFDSGNSPCLGNAKDETAPEEYPGGSTYPLKERSLVLFRGFREKEKKQENLSSS